MSENDINTKLLNGREVSYSSIEVPVSPNLPSSNVQVLAYKVHPLRWYILGVLCMLQISNAIGWITFAPIANYAADYYATSLDNINYLSVVFMIATIPCGLVAIWILDSFGLRAALVIGAWLNVIGLTMRWLSARNFLTADLRFPVVMVGQSIAAMAQPFCLFSPTKLAALWFPDNHRALANTIGQTSNPLGILISFAVSPLIVTEKSQIPMLLFYYMFPGIVAVIMASLCIYKGVPPTPPSASAAAAHEPFYTGVKKLFRNFAYVMLFLSFGAGYAMFSAFSSLLSEILGGTGYNDDFSGLCGALIIIFGLVGAFISGLYVDKTKKFGVTAKVTYCFGVLSLIAFAIVSRFQDQYVAIAVTTAAFGFFGFASMPISFELAVEATYPIAEGTSGGFIAMSGQIQGIILVVVGQYLAQPMSVQPTANYSEGADFHIAENATSFPTLEPSLYPGQDLTYTMIFFMVYGAIACLIFLFGVQTKYHRLIAERGLEDDKILNYAVPLPGQPQRGTPHL